MKLFSLEPCARLEAISGAKAEALPNVGSACHVQALCCQNRSHGGKLVISEFGIMPKERAPRQLGARDVRNCRVYLATGGDTTVQIETAAAMNESLQHRGPDDDGIWIDPEAGVALAHRRLSIVDLSPAGHQPMVSADGRYVIIYNGEVYSHEDIRPSLTGARLHVPRPFRHRSDAGIGCRISASRRRCQRLIGMFAIALWDRTRPHADAGARPARHQAALLGEVRQICFCSARSSRRCARIRAGRRASTAARSRASCATTTSRHRTRSTRACTSSSPARS